MSWGKWRRFGSLAQILQEAVNLFGAITFDCFSGVFAYNDTFFLHGNN
jgi:hypothetical protein